MTTFLTIMRTECYKRMPIACCSLVDFYTTHMNTRRSVPYTLWQSLLFMPNRVACPYSYHRHMYCSMYIVVIQAALKDFLVRMQPALDRTATWHSNNTATVLSIYFFIHIFFKFWSILMCLSSLGWLSNQPNKTTRLSWKLDNNF